MAETSAVLSYSPLSAGFGVVVDFDPEVELSDAEVECFRALFSEHHLLLVRGREVSAEAHRRLLSYLDEVIVQECVSNKGHEAAVAKRGELVFHGDYTAAPVPMRGLSLYAEQISETAATTRFASGVNAFRRLDAELQTKLQGMSAIHIWEPDVADRPRRLEDVSEYCIVTDHPIVMQVPDSAASTIYACLLDTAKINECDQAESDRLFAEIFAKLYADDNIYEHKWQPHDLVIWDNVALQHARGEVAPEQAPRVLRRFVFGDRQAYEDFMADKLERERRWKAAGSPGHGTTGNY